MKNKPLLATSYSKHERLDEVHRTMGGGLCWHVHHDRLVEWCFDYCARSSYIRSDKPDDEIPLRLKLMRWVNYSTMPRWLEKIASDACRDWMYDLRKQNLPERHWWRRHQEFNEKLIEYLIPARAKLALLHRQQCPDCPWQPMGGNCLFGTIFPKH